MSPVASSATPLPITVIILAFNEEIHIERCLQRLAGWVERMVVISGIACAMAKRGRAAVAAEATSRLRRLIMDSLLR